VLYAASRFQSNTFTFPEDILDPDKKKSDSPEGREWARQTAEALYSLYVRDQTALLYSRRHDFGLNRLYAEGNQPTTKYIQQLIPGDTKTHERKGYMNISWDILSVAPKFRAVVLGMFKKMSHDVIATAIDDKAGAEREDMKLAAMAESRLKPFLERQGFQTNEAKLPFLPDTEEEVGILEEMGSFKLVEEEAIEKAVDLAFYESDWENIKERIYGDLFDLDVAGSIDYIDQENQRVRCKYVDPVDLIVKYSKDKKFEKMNEWGYIDHYNLSELRRITQGQITPEQLGEIVQSYCGYGGNPTGYDYDYYDYNYGYAGTQAHDDFKICVMELEWYSTDILVHEKGTTKFGQKLFSRRGYDFKPGKKSKRVQTSIKTIYTCKWIVGTEYVFDFGKQNDIPMGGPKRNEPKFSLNIYKNSNKSTLASIIPLLDSIQITWLKIQNAIAKAAPAGLAVEIGALENMNIKGQEFTPLDILTIRRQTGDLLFRATTHHSQLNSPSASRPVNPIEGGVGKHLEELLAKMNWDIQMIREITGISRAVDATDPEARTAVGTTEMAAAGTSNILYNIYKGYVWIKESTARSMVLRFQVLTRNGDVKGYYPALGKSTMEVLKIGSNKLLRQMGIKLEVRPTDEMKGIVRQAAMNSVKRGEEGKGGITMDDYLEIELLMDKGNLKRAKAVLAYKDKIRKREAQEFALKSQQQQTDGNIQLEQAKTKELESRIVLETKGKIAFDNAKKLNTMDIDNNKHKNKMIELGQQSVIDHVAAGRDAELANEEGLPENIQQSPAPSAAPIQATP